MIGHSFIRRWILMVKIEIYEKATATFFNFNYCGNMLLSRHQYEKRRCCMIANETNIRKRPNDTEIYKTWYRQLKSRKRTHFHRILFKKKWPFKHLGDCFKDRTYVADIDVLILLYWLFLPCYSLFNDYSSC